MSLHFKTEIPDPKPLEQGAVNPKPCQAELSLVRPGFGSGHWQILGASRWKFWEGAVNATCFLWLCGFRVSFWSAFGAKKP